jgi:N utilization substance protein B
LSRRATAARHQLRRVALQVLYAVDLAPGAGSGPPVSSEEAFEAVATNFDLPAGAHAFAKTLVCGSIGCASQIDALLAAHAKNWRVSRMAAVDRNILRLACYELMRTDTPASVILDEAIELARRFGSDASPAFVNGVLDAVAREVRAGDMRGEQAAGARNSGDPEP